MVTTELGCSHPVAIPEKAFQWPVLRKYLQQDGFTLIPNHLRPLDGRIVGTWFDPATGGPRPVTDYEIVGRFLFGAESEQAHTLGRMVRQTWYFRVEGIKLRCNEAFEQWTHHGLQYVSTCQGCGEERWNNADRVPHPLCQVCRQNRSERCPDTDLACSTAYKRHGCRCLVCRRWNAAKHRALRFRRDNPVVSSVQTPKKVLTPTPVCWSTNNGVTRWTWLPSRVRQTLARYERDLEAIELELLPSDEPRNHPPRFRGNDSRHSRSRRGRGDR